MYSNLSLYAILRRILSELNEQIVDHGDRVAYLYLKMAEFREKEDNRYFENMMLTCYAHDIGAYKTEKFLDLLRFDVTHTLEHCVYGYLFMKYFSPIGDDAEVLLYHHTYYSDRDKYESPHLDEGILIHFLDRVDIFSLKYDSNDDVIHQCMNGAGRNFNPKDVEEFIAAEEKYSILQHLRDGSYRSDVQNYFNQPHRLARLLGPIINMLAYEVDFKSEQTVIHSITTTLLATILASKLGLSADEIRDLEYAARVHDLGKIDVDSEILEKPGKLTAEEYQLMKRHVEYTEVILRDLFPAPVTIIASHHHERLDGSGYPRGLRGDQLSLSDRIMQVADVASALLQRRSYKEALDKETVVSILQQEAANGKLDAAIISLLVEEYDGIIPEVWERSKDTIRCYEGLQAEYQHYLAELNQVENDEFEEFDLFPNAQ